MITADKRLQMMKKKAAAANKNQDKKKWKLRSPAPKDGVQGLDGTRKSTRHKWRHCFSKRIKIQSLFVRMFAF